MIYQEILWAWAGPAPRDALRGKTFGNTIADEKGMGDWFDQNIRKMAFRLELKKNKRGSEKMLWHGLDNGEQRTFDVDPHTGFWRRFGIGFMGLFPIDSQL